MEHQFKPLFDLARFKSYGEQNQKKGDLMSDPTIAAKFPAKAELEPGKNYAWCACGLSKNQPFCDGSHKTTDLKPVIFKVEEKKTAYLCQCKHTKNPPYCDGTHKSLP